MYAGVVQNSDVTFPIATRSDARIVTTHDESRSSDAATANVYYVTDLTVGGGPGVVIGGTAYFGQPGSSDGILLSDDSQVSFDFCGHELGHLLLGSSTAPQGNGFYTHLFRSDIAHSGNATNLLAPGTIRILPDVFHQVKDPAAVMMVALDTSGPSQPGRANGNLDQ